MPPHLFEIPVSGKVMIKEAELKDHTVKDGVNKSLIQYRLTKKEYLYKA